MSSNGGPPPHEKCSSSKLPGSEKNDKLLYLWQRAAFMDSGQGLPREIMESLRIRIALLGSYHTEMRKVGMETSGTNELLKDYLDRYTMVMDERDESKGMNNVVGVVNALSAGRKSNIQGQKDRKIGLQMSVLRDMPEFKTLMKDAEIYSQKLSLASNIPPSMNCASISSGSHPRSSSSHNPQFSSSHDPLSSSSHARSHDPLSSCSHDPRSHDHRPSSTRSHTVNQAKETNLVAPPNIEQKRLFQYSTGASMRKPLNEAHQVSTRSRTLSSGGPRGPKYPQDPCFSETRFPPTKRLRGSRESDDEVVSTKEKGDSGIHVFRSAREEYIKQQQYSKCRGGGGGGYSSDGASFGSSNYGSSKKALGTRRGAGNRFVPPVRRDPDDYESCGSNQAVRGGGKKESVLPPELEGDERLRNIEPRMVELIMNEIIDHGAPVQWNDIAGLEYPKATIKEIVVWPMLRPDLFTGLRGPPKGILLFGPPGTGKTLIGKCIASQVEATFFSISASSLTSKWIGEGEKMVRALFAVARCFQPAVIFMDEIDSLLTQRSDTEHESSRRIKTEFLVQLDGATTSNEDRLLVIGATNRPQEIDEAARRRLVKRLYIPLPDSSARKQIILNLMKDQPFEILDDKIDFICSRTEGYSGADVANLCREAAYGPVREASSNIQHISAEDMRKVMLKDFEAALPVIKPSVSEKDLALYLDWNRQFGCGGTISV